MSVESIIEEVIRKEGGYAEHPDDPGGATMYGITQAVARANGWDAPMRDLPIEKARQIYFDRYYRGPGFDKVHSLDERVAEELTDTGINMGVETAVKFLQRSLNALNLKGELYQDVPVDGVLGERTFDAFKSFGMRRGQEGISVLLKALNCLQGARYIEIVEKREASEAFLYGWLRIRVTLPPNIIAAMGVEESIGG